MFQILARGFLVFSDPIQKVITFDFEIFRELRQHKDKENDCLNNNQRQKQENKLRFF